MGTFKNFFLSCGIIGGIGQVGLYSSKNLMRELIEKMYDKYKDDVLMKKNRGLKLMGGKRANQLDNKEFTTSNFDDLKELLNT